MEIKSLGSYECLQLSRGGYTLRIIPELGGQVIALEKEGRAALREPASQEDLQQASTSYGLPILFPPNRIDGGRFQAAGRCYQFQINEPARGNSLHGFLHKRPWQVIQASDALTELQLETDEQTDFYLQFPHRLRAVQSCALSEKGLEHTVTIQNLGDEPMPVGLGFHSAFAADSDCRVRISVGQRVLMTDRMLPSGQVRPLNEQELRFRAEGLPPTAWAMDDHYTAEPIEAGGKRFHGAMVDHGSWRVLYEVDPFYQHWMIWNAGQRGDVICLEPQNWRVNAPNLVSAGMSEAEAGMKILQSGETMTVRTRLWIETES